MGTRSLICVFYKSRFVIAQYSQWDGYPEGAGQGMKILNFLLDPANISRLTAGLEHAIPLTVEVLKELRDGGKVRGLTFAEINDLAGASTSRDTGAGILELVAQATAEKPVPLVLELDFANDGLFCEWAYVIDLDAAVFEVFEGSVYKDGARSNRFLAVGKPEDPVPCFRKGFPFAELPKTEDEFITTLNKAYDEIMEERRAAKNLKQEEGNQSDS